MNQFLGSLFHSLNFILSLAFVLALLKVNNPRRKLFWLRVVGSLVVSIATSSLIRWGLISLVKLLDNNVFLSDFFEFIFMLACVFFALLGLLFMFRISFRKALFLVTISCLIEHLSRNIFNIMFFLLPCEATRALYFNRFSFTAINLSFIMIFAFLFWLLVIRKQISKFDYDETLKNDRFILVSFVNLFFCLGVYSFTSFTLSGTANQFTVNIICSIYAILCCFLGLYLQINIVTSNKLENDKKTLDILIKRESQKNISFSENVGTLQIEIHDLKKRLLRLEEADINPEDKASIINDFNAIIDKYNNFVKTGNPVMDSLLANRYLMASREEVDFTYFVDGKAIDFMEADDVIALFDNLLSNAFDAALNEAKENRVIHLQVVNEKQMTMVTIRNYCSSEPNFINGIPMTSKDKKYHGFGVKSIRRIAHKYNGEVNFNYNNNFFTCRLIFPNTNDNK